jgi:hypothetical protein
MLNVQALVYERMHLITTIQAGAIPWSGFPAECLWYFVPMIPVHLVAFGVGAMVLAFLPAKQPGQFPRRIRRLAVFLAVFLVVGSLVLYRLCKPRPA